ncbi:MAG: FAD-dependent oxidoreductase [Bacilli bacterium]
MKRIVIIGGNTLGVSAALRLRQLSEEDEIIIIERNLDLSIKNDALPYYIGDTITKQVQLYGLSKEQLVDEYQIIVHNGYEAFAIDRKVKEVCIKDYIDEKLLSLSYDYLILATGSIPIETNYIINEDSNHFVLGNINDALAIKEYIINNDVENVNIVGNDYLALELALNLRKLNLNVNVITSEDKILSKIDDEITMMVEKEYISNGVNFIYKVDIKDVDTLNQQIRLSNNTFVTNDLLIYALGLKSNAQLATLAKIKTGETGSIIVNKNFQTNDSSIYAGGDVIELEHYYSKEKVHVSATSLALTHGYLIANHINNIEVDQSLIFGTSVFKSFSGYVCATGLSYEKALELGIDATSLVVHNQSSTTNIISSLKIIYNPLNMEIIGASAYGDISVLHDINIIATAMYYNSTINHLSDIQLAYVAPYNHDHALVYQVGQYARLIANKIYTPVTIKDFHQIIKRHVQVINVSTTSYENNLRAIDIPLAQLRNRLNEIDFNQDIYLISNKGNKAIIAASIIKNKGFTHKIYILSGGLYLYEYYYLSKAVEVNTTIYLEDALRQIENFINDINQEEIQIVCDDLSFFDEIKILSQLHPITYHDLVIKNNKVIVNLIKKQLSQESESKQQAVFIIDTLEYEKLETIFLIAKAKMRNNQSVKLCFSSLAVSMLRKDYLKYTNKTLIERFISFGLPNSFSKVKITKYNFFGIGTFLYKKQLQEKGFKTVEMLYEDLVIMDCEIVAVLESLIKLGFNPNELHDYVKIEKLTTIIKMNNSTININTI